MSDVTAQAFREAAEDGMLKRHIRQLLLAAAEQREAFDRVRGEYDALEQHFKIVVTVSRDDPTDRHADRRPHDGDRTEVHYGKKSPR
jgi:hypothetical protein